MKVDVDNWDNDELIVKGRTPTAAKKEEESKAAESQVKTPLVIKGDTVKPQERNKIDTKEEVKQKEEEDWVVSSEAKDLPKKTESPPLVVVVPEKIDPLKKELAIVPVPAKEQQEKTVAP